MAIPYLEHFLDSLDTLPADLQRNFTLMKDLDTRTQDLVKKINNQSYDYVGGANDFSACEKTDKFKDINDMFEKAKEYSDDKVGLATQTYEMVDKHIRRLDSELARLETELKEKQIATAGNCGEENKKKGRAAGREKKGSFNPKNVIKEEAEKKKMLLMPEVMMPSCSVGEHVLAALNISSDVLDMPVDPNEPTYCICHQVSYGEMIGCDNADCPIEWFHFGCVGLISKPKGKWFCPKCTSDRKKK